MSEREDDRILSLLYEEAPESHTPMPLSKEAEEDLEAYRGVLASVRAVPDDEPSPHLDALILAHAREAAEKAALGNLPWWRRLLSNRGLSLALAATATVFVAVLAVPTLQERAPESQSIPDLPKAKSRVSPKNAAVEPVAQDSFGAVESAGALEPAALAEAPTAELEKKSEERPSPERDAPSGRRGASRSLADEGEARAPAPLAAEPALGRFDERTKSGKGDSTRSPGPSTVGTLAGVGSGGVGMDKDRARENEVQGLDDVVSRAKAKKTADSKEQAEVAAAHDGEDADMESRMHEPPPAVAMAAPAAPAEQAPASPPPSDERSSTGSSRRSSPASTPAKPAAPRKEASPPDGGASIASIRSQAKRFESTGDVEGARRFLLLTRRQHVGKPMYEQVSYELAELELRQRRYAVAEAYARDVLTTKDSALAERAQALIRVARAAAR